MLKAFERRLEQLVEGTFAAAFRSSLQPVEVGRRLIRVLDDERTVGVDGRPVMPNRFVIGVSPDDDESHERFRGKQNLNFPLVADPERSIIDAYGVWGEKKLYGKTFMGLQRATFLIDEAGVIQHVFKRPKVAEHAEEIISKL